MNLRIAIAVTALIAVVPAAAAPLVFPDRDRAGVVDAAHVLTAAQAAALNNRVVAWDKATGHQLAVATIPSLQGHEIADYGYQLGRAWGLGRKGIDDGVVLILAPTEHKVRIEVGRGLEGDLTDADTAEILLNTVVPRLKAHDIPGALAGGADAIMAAVPADAGDLSNAPQSSGSIWPFLLGALGLVGAAATAVFVVFDRRRRKSIREFEERRRKVEEEMEAGARKRRAATVPPQAEVHVPMPATRRRDPSAPLLHTGGYVPKGSGEPGTPPNTGSGASKPATPPPVIAPVIIDNSTTYESPRRRDDDSSSSSSWSSSDSGSSSSSWDSGSSSSGFDSGGGSFSGGGSDNSW